MSARTAAWPWAQPAPAPETRATDRSLEVAQEAWRSDTDQWVKFRDRALDHYKSLPLTIELRVNGHVVERVDGTYDDFMAYKKDRIGFTPVNMVRADVPVEVRAITPEGKNLGAIMRTLRKEFEMQQRGAMTVYQRAQTLLTRVAQTYDADLEPEDAPDFADAHAVMHGAEPETNFGDHVEDARKSARLRRHARVAQRARSQLTPRERRMALRRLAEEAVGSDEVRERLSEAVSEVMEAADLGDLCEEVCEEIQQTAEFEDLALLLGEVLDFAAQGLIDEEDDDEGAFEDEIVVVLGGLPDYLLERVVLAARDDETMRRFLDEMDAFDPNFTPEQKKRLRRDREDRLYTSPVVPPPEPPKGKVVPLLRGKPVDGDGDCDPEPAQDRSARARARLPRLPRLPRHARPA